MRHWIGFGSSTSTRWLNAVRTPDIRQCEATECGLASLAIVLGYHGRHVSLDDMRAAAGDLRNGTTGLQLARIARQFGLRLKPAIMDLEQLSRLSAPAILHLRFNHFAVVETVETAGLRLNDPATGPRFAPFTDLDDDFTGIVLTVLAEQRPVCEGHPFNIVSETVLLLLQVPASALFHRLAVVGTILAAWWVAMDLRERMDTVIDPFSAGFALAAVCAALTLRAAASVKLATAIESHVTARALAWINSAAPDACRNRTPASFAELASLRGKTLLASCFVWSDALLLAGLFMVALAVGPLLACVPIAMIVVQLLAVGWVITKRGRALTGALNDTPRVVVPTYDDIAGIGLDPTAQRDGDLFTRLTGSQALVLKSLERLRGRYLSVVVGRQAAAAMTVLATLLVAGVELQAGYATNGTVFSVTGLCVAMVLLAREIQAGAMQAVDGLGSLVVWRDVRRSRATTREGPTGVPVGPSPVGIEGVSIRHRDSGHPILDNVSMPVPAGCHLAITGPSGSGKSLLLDLCCGLSRPLAGEVRIGGQLAADALQASPECFFFLPRTSTFIAGSLRSNLCFGLDHLDDAKLERNLSSVRLWHEIARRGGLSLQLTSGAPELSGGQRQRLALARALLRNPSLICIDCGFDAIDDATVASCLDALRAIGTTVLLVTGRPGIATLCDRTIALPVLPETAGERR